MKKYRERWFRWKNSFIGTNCWQQDIRRREYILAIAIRGGIALLVAYLFYNAWWALLPVSVLAGILMKQWYGEICKKKEGEFREQFQDALQLFSTALKTGYSVENALQDTYTELLPLHGKTSRVCREFNRMLYELQLHIGTEQVFQGFAKRVRQEDVEDFVTVFVTAKKIGGDSIGILRATVETMREKAETEREIRTLLAAKRLEFHILCVIPLAMIFYMRIAFPAFLSVLYGNIIGILFMSFNLVLYGAAYYLGKRMIDIEV